MAKKKRKRGAPAFVKKGELPVGPALKKKRKVRMAEARERRARILERTAAGRRAFDELAAGADMSDLEHLPVVSYPLGRPPKVPGLAAKVGVNAGDDGDDEEPLVEHEAPTPPPVAFEQPPPEQRRGGRKPTVFEEAKTRIVTGALAETGGNISEVARKLEVPRSAVKNIMRRSGITLDDIVEVAPDEPNIPAPQVEVSAVADVEKSRPREEPAPSIPGNIPAPLMRAIIEMAVESVLAEALPPEVEDAALAVVTSLRAFFHAVRVANIRARGSDETAAVADGSTANATNTPTNIRANIREEPPTVVDMSSVEDPLVPLAPQRRRRVYTCSACGAIGHGKGTKECPLTTEPTVKKCRRCDQPGHRSDHCPLLRTAPADAEAAPPEPTPAP